MSESKVNTYSLDEYMKLQQENAELLGSWHEIKNVLEDTQKEVARLECIIAERQKQKPVAFYWVNTNVLEWLNQKPPKGEMMEQVKLFASPVIQEGMQLVPIEPTEKMISALFGMEYVWDTAKGQMAYYDYKAMLNASKEGV